ncbi:ComF family protein [Paenibacillus sp. YN15]|uniref:ComF family protein n=1 Tax=Paenibacillus sp. YN15 TaxID=1742774 RepID=UPI000DCF0B9B|nr:ComF family protein [Paenibacillus sp. YN15]RAV03113.1 ComF family protein [Paenibacillus sp. YN15]
MKSIRQWLLHSMAHLIAPPARLCSLCGQARQYAGWNPLRVCDACFQSMPWIREVECPVCGRAEHCPDCLRLGPRALVMNRSAVSYDDDMRQLLAMYKYRGNERLQVLLGRMLVHAYGLYMLDPAMKKRGFDCITFVPVSPERAAERGFNQAEQMAVILGEQVGLPVVSLLSRQRHTGKQSKMSRHERMENMRGAFAVIPGRAAKLQRALKRQKLRILIVDDVYTTGSTLTQCAEAICGSLPQARIYGLCWAR